MADNQTDSSYIESFKDEKNNFPIFLSELVMIRNAKGKQNDLEKEFPTTEHELVGLALSGGGIRSATFNLGFLQALSRQGHLKNVDYLSTVSGGGYIGSSLTTLLNSDFSDSDESMDLLDGENFPFSIQCEKKKQNEPSTECHPHGKDFLKPGKEKEPVEHLRYYSNYLTAAGNVIDKYFRPAMVMARGVVLNFCLMIPYILIVGLLLSLFFFKIPTTLTYKHTNISIGKYFLNLEAFETALEDRKTALETLKNYVLKNTAEFPRTPYEDRLKTLSSMDEHANALKKMQKTIENKRKAFIEVSRSVWRLPLVGFLIMLFINLFLIGRVTQTFNERFKSSKILSRMTFKRRLKSSKYLSCILLFSLALLLINLFGVALVYWKLPPEIGFISLLSFLAPNLLGKDQNATENQKKPWMRLVTSIFLFALAPLFLLFLVGMVIKFFIPTFGYFELIGIAFVTGVISGKWININKISLHNFYRDRLSRAYLIQNSSEEKKPSRQFEKIKHCDDLKMGDLRPILPYHIINTNLNLTKKLPSVDKDGNFVGGVLRNGESFIFSHKWCGSEKTGYRKTIEYEKNDPHLDLGTAMAISGAAVNIGMAQSNLPIFRLLLGLLNIRLGYWAFHPRQKPLNKWQRMAIKSPGSWSVIKELIGLYTLDGEFINLSDGGHFDNIGVYELLRRRCKYIIVGDAEADPEMRFQALSYIIRLARIDFGIDIDIDVSDIQREKGTGFSRNHCAVGIINYPAIDGMDEEVGYLLYCKSSLTGNEPQHLHEYRTKHPQFPHQTTADQWFDEQQFEAYRELGYQVGKKAFKPATYNACRENLEANFIKLKEFWHPHCPAVERHFTKHGQELNAIISQVKNDDDLIFMDAQMFPEWDELMAGITQKPDRQLWLPDSSVVVRKGFYVCNLMIQLMENVYLDLNLEKHHDHPDNRGRMNLFRHWSWAGIFRVTWAISACTYGSRFQHFCRDKLDLELGEVSIENLTKTIVTKENEPIQAFTDQHAKDLACFLNEYERLLVKKLINTKEVSATHLFSFHLMVKDPLDESQQKKFGFGFALMNEKKIAYFRIQDHLRDMGLGRIALKELIIHIQEPYKLKPEILKQDIKLDEKALEKYKYGLEDKKLDLYDKEFQKTDPNMFKQMLSSVISEL